MVHNGRHATTVVVMGSGWQESFGGGWLMCYTSAGGVDIANEYEYDFRLPYGVDGYR